MKTQIIFFLVVLLFLGFCGGLRAGPIGNVTVQPSIDDGGNKWRTRASTGSGSVVLLSTNAVTATDTKSTVGFWRYREIINLSTNSILLLTPEPCLNYTVLPSSIGVILSSRTALATGSINFSAAINTAEAKYIVPHQAGVCGQWDSTTQLGPLGATINETFER